MRVLALAVVLAGCGHTNDNLKIPEVQRIRMAAIQTDAIIYKREAQADRQCRKAIEKNAMATGVPALNDDNSPVTEANHFRGCLIAPLHPGLYWHLISSLETVDNLAHELCHRFTTDRKKCDSIHFDRDTYPGRTVEIP